MEPENKKVPQENGQEEVGEAGKNSLPQQLPGIADASIGRIRGGVLENVFRVSRGEMIETRIHTGEEVCFFAVEQLRNCFEVCPTGCAELLFIQIISPTARTEHLVNLDDCTPG